MKLDRTKINKAPRLRFPQFNDDWQNVKVGDVFNVRTGVRIVTPRLSQTQTPEKPYPVYSSQTKNEGVWGYYSEYLYENAITWTVKGTYTGTVKYRGWKFYAHDGCGILLSKVMQPDRAIAEALNRVAKKYTVGHHDKSQLITIDMANIKVFIPGQKEEREKVAAFLSSIDKLYTLEQRELDALKKMKRAMLQSMFAREGEQGPRIRFREFSDAWKQLELSDVVDIQPGKTYRHLQPGNIPVYGSGGYMLKVCEHLYTSDAVGLGARGTINRPFILRAPFWAIESLFCAFPREGYLLGFVFYTFQRVNWRKKDLGTVISSLSKKDVQATKITAPSYSEQTKIAEFLSLLDNLIAIKKRELETFEKLKKAINQKMFI